MTRFSVALHGVPIATVDLPLDRAWAGGRVTPLPTFGRVAELLAAAAEAPSFAAALLELPSGESLATETLESHVACAYRELMAMRLELLDEGGLPAGAELVRLAPLGAGAAGVVRVQFRHAPGSVAANMSPSPRRDGDLADGRR